MDDNIKHMEENMHKEPLETEKKMIEMGTWYAPLTIETLFSKYFSMVLFVALPFVGFLLGFLYAGQECVEDVVGRDIAVKNRSDVVTEILPKEEIKSKLEIVSCCDIEHLQEIISKEGKVNIIVSFDIDFTPEGYLSEEEVQKQHDEIKEKREKLIQEIGQENIFTITEYVSVPHVHFICNEIAFEKILVSSLVKQVSENKENFAY